MVAPLVYAVGYFAVEYGIPMLVSGYTAYQAGQVLANPEAQRAIGQAANSLANALTPDKSQENENVRADATTNEETQKCDGPHRGRIQVQGYAKNIDPYDLTTAKPPISYVWNRPCTPPLRPEGLAGLSGLVLKTQDVSHKSAGYRGPAFSKMSQHIKKSPSRGFLASKIGWGINPATGNAVINGRAGPKGARVDLDIMTGRAFGDK